MKYSKVLHIKEAKKLKQRSIESTKCAKNTKNYIKQLM